MQTVVFVSTSRRTVLTTRSLPRRTLTSHFTAKFSTSTNNKSNSTSKRPCMGLFNSKDKTMAETGGPTTNALDQANAAATREAGQQGSSGSLEVLNAIPRVGIDDGLQKYVLMQVVDDSGKEHYFVRGDVTASYHNDAATPLVREFESKGIMYEVLGGGRILHEACNKTIKVYGHSYGFPWANGVYQHDKSVATLKQTYTDYNSIYFDNDGY